MIKVVGECVDGQESVLTDDALEFIYALNYGYAHKISLLLEKRREVQSLYDKGMVPSLDNSFVRSSSWTVAPIPDDLQDRKVEITGPVGRKMIINALNSGANVFMADFEDSNSPTWANIINGQINLRDAVLKTISYHDKKKDKHYSLNENTAVLMVRPRGLHLYEKNVLFGNKPVPASLFDFGLYFYNNAKNLMENNTGPYFYLPKLEGSSEAALWNDIFKFSEDYIGIRRGTIRATVLLETLPAAFEMDEILWELKNYSAGLNCGRWDYIFSFIKKFKNNKKMVLPNRDQVGMDRAFLQAYSLLLIKTCHKRGVHAMGGMAAQIPIKNDVKANEAALKKVYDDKVREADSGHDGTWVAHPGLVKIAKEVFESKIKDKNQIHILRDDVTITENDLLKTHDGTITEEGVRKNISIGIMYIEAWLRGIGCVPLFNLMEDAATAEISRAQLWQWLRHKSSLDNGKTLDEKLFLEIFNEELNNINKHLPSENRLEDASEMFLDLCTSPKFEEFLTTNAYKHIK